MLEWGVLARRQVLKRVRFKGRLAIFATAIVLSLAAAPNKRSYSPKEKAYYAANAVVNFVRPGLVFNLSNAQIAQDGTITVRVKVTDPQGGCRLIDSASTLPVRSRSVSSPPPSPKARRNTRHTPLAHKSRLSDPGPVLSNPLPIPVGHSQPTAMGTTPTNSVSRPRPLLMDPPRTPLAFMAAAI